MRKIACLFVVLAGLSLSACDDVRGYPRMEGPPVDFMAGLIVTFGVLGTLLARRRSLKE